MKKLHFIGIIFLLTLILIGQACAGSLQDLDKKNGFRDAKLGMPLDSLHGLTFIRNSTHVKTYARKGDDLKIGDATLDSIQYDFYERKLVGITLKCHRKYLGYIRDVFTAAYGPFGGGIGNVNDEDWYGSPFCAWMGTKVELRIWTYPKHWGEFPGKKRSIMEICFSSPKLDQEISNDLNKSNIKKRDSIIKSL